MRPAMLPVQDDPTRVAAIRRDLKTELEARSVTPDSIYDVVLVVSELVGNAVVHASAHGFIVAWEINDNSVVVRVDDSSDGMPTATQAGTSDTGGRGLAIVAALSQEWGVIPSRQGKQVWARVPIAHAA